jgi:hypothetical protein
MEQAVLARPQRWRRAVDVSTVPGLALLTAIVAFSPVAGVACALLLLVGAALVAIRHERMRVRSVELSAPLAVVGAGALIVIAPATLLAISVWPVLALPVAAIVAFLALAWQAPAAAVAVAVLLFGFEGSVKVLLGLADGQLPAGNREIGAALLDACLFSAVALLVFRDRLRAPRRLWRNAARAERAVLILLGLWFATSVLQIAQGGDLGRGVEGFRLFQAYTLVAVGALVAVGTGRATPYATRAILAIGLVVGGYAAFRVAFGAADAERELALSAATVTRYGGVERATGSFSSAVGLTSFLTPMVVFGLVAGYFSPRLRAAGWLVAALGIVGIVGSYGRSPLFAVALGLLFAVGLTAAAADIPLRRKLAVAGLALGVLGATYAGVWFASGDNAALRQRAEGVVNPLGDESLRMRFDTWSGTLDEIARKPLGHGVGTVGSASASERAFFKTTDNSFIKVLYEQGIPVGGTFLAALIALVGIAALRLRRAAADSRGLGIAALSGFVAFVGLAMTGEYVEQPGKVVAWSLLGVALAEALGPVRRDDVSGAANLRPDPRGA